ncbi:hypothetical protein L209DRAFT_754330 [Thermothelomyces heterothallicus CBS 203.75]
MIASPCVSRPGKKNGNSPRVRKRQKPIALTVPGQQIAKPIVWPVELTRQTPARRKITIPQTAFEQLPPLFALPLDIRHHIYSLMLQEAGKRQHIFCPSVSRRGLPTALQLRYLLSKSCYDTNNVSCGHYECEHVHSDRDTKRAGLAGFVALMLTCKFAYQEVSHFLYSETTFTFPGFGELDAFLDWISPETALSIRSVTFIAHMLPNGTEHCKELIEGNYFRGAGRDHVALFRRMPNLRKLDIRFFPSAMLAFTTKFVDMMKPLEELPRTVAIGVVLPRVYYRQDRSGDGLPFVGRFGAGASFYSVARPVVFAGVVATSCEVYRKFF